MYKKRTYKKRGHRHKYKKRYKPSVKTEFRSNLYHFFKALGIIKFNNVPTEIVSKISYWLVGVLTGKKKNAKTSHRTK